MAYPDFNVGAGAMANQPTRIRFIPAQPRFSRTASGGMLANRRADGARVVVTWGTDVAEDGAYDELIADLGGTLKHTITWTDPAGNAFSVVCVAENVSQTFGPAKLFSSFTVTFFEIPS